MRLPLTVPLLAAGILVAAVACGDAPTTSAPQSIPSIPPGDTPPIPALGPGTIGVATLEIPVGTSVVLRGPLVSQSSGAVDDGTLTWLLSDSAVAKLHGPNSGTRILDGNKAGTTELTITGSRLQAKVRITVLDTTAAQSPVVVDDFHLIEIPDEDGVIYAPQLVLRDTSGRGASAVIGLWLEIPSVGGTTRCAMLRPIGRLPTELFHDGDVGTLLLGWASHLANDSPVIAHVALRVPGPLAKEITVVAGRAAPGGWPPNRAGSNEDVLSCG